MGTRTPQSISLTMSLRPAPPLAAWVVWLPPLAWALGALAGTLGLGR